MDRDGKSSDRSGAIGGCRSGTACVTTFPALRDQDADAEPTSLRLHAHDRQRLPGMVHRRSLLRARFPDMTDESRASSHQNVEMPTDR